MKEKGFTLVEVLVTVTIIGIVAALTLPTIMTIINKKVTENSEKVFRSKMIKGFNLTKTAGDLNSKYSSTYDFLKNGLGKHLKLVTICDSSHIRNCLPYDIIKYNKDVNTEETFEVKKLSTAHSLNLKEDNGFKDSAAFVLADGTVVVGSYNLNCTVDDGKLDQNISACFDGLYDLNGSRKPNKLGKDILPIHSAGIDASPVVLATLGGVKIISNAQVYDGVAISEYCENGEPIKEYKKAEVNTCVNGSRWAAAAKACHDMGGRLPKEEELAKMAEELYGTTIPYATHYTYSNLNLNVSKIPNALSGLGSSFTELWSNQENGANRAHARIFNSDSTYDDRGHFQRYQTRSDILAVCVTD